MVGWLTVCSYAVGSFVGLLDGLNAGLRMVGLEVVVGLRVAGFDVGLLLGSVVVTFRCDTEPVYVPTTTFD